MKKTETFTIELSGQHHDFLYLVEAVKIATDKSAEEIIYEMLVHYAAIYKIKTKI